MIGELSSILISILSTSVVGTLIGTLLYWRYNRKLKALEVDKAKIETENERWHLYKEQLDCANQRIVELLHINAEKEERLIAKDKRYAERISEVEERFNKQTDYLRTVQHNYKRALEDINTLTIKIGLMQRIIDHLKQWFCRRPFKECERRKPEQTIKPVKYIPLREMNTDINELMKEIIPEAATTFVGKEGGIEKVEPTM